VHCLGPLRYIVTIFVLLAMVARMVRNGFHEYHIARLQVLYNVSWVRMNVYMYVVVHI